MKDMGKNQHEELSIDGRAGYKIHDYMKKKEMLRRKVEEGKHLNI